MGIKFYCPTCDKRLNVKSFLAGKSGFCPHCQAKVQIPVESQPKRAAAAADAGASTLIRQESRLPEAREEAATPSGHASGNGHTKGHASTPAPAAHGGSAPAAPRAGAPPGASPQAHSAPAPHANPQPAPSPAPVRPATAPAASAVPAAPMASSAPAVGDAIAEAPHAVWYVRPPAGGQYGPAAGDVMRKWLGEGRVSADSLVWREGWPDWRKAAKVFPSLAPVTAPAAPAASGAAPLPGPAASSTRRAIRSPRRRDSNTFAITAIIVLVLASLALLGGLLWVLGIFG
jgi:hypothetical protein